MKIKNLALAVLLATCFTARAQAQNALTIAACATTELLATIENISTSFCYTGDDNENATALVQFRASGSGSWLNAYTPFIDRRYTLGGSANTRSREARVSIVGSTETATSPISPNTLYEVQITWTDPDGVTGTNPRLGTVTTWPETPSVMAGSTCTVPATAISTCLLGLGTTYSTMVLQASGAPYAPFVVSNGGASSTEFVRVQFESGAYVEYTTSANLTGINVTDRYVWLDTPQCGQAYYSCVTVTDVSTVYITDISSPQTSSGCAADPGGSNSQNAAGIRLHAATANPSEIFMIGGTLSSLTLSSVACTPSGASNGSPTDGIRFTGGTQNTLVVKGITISGGFRDGVGTFNTVSRMENIDYINNIVSETKDDAFDTKPGGINTRIAMNQCTPGLLVGGTDDRGVVCYAVLSNNTAATIGPVYVHHNYCHPTGDAEGGNCVKGGGSQAYYFHNTFDSTPQSTGGVRWGSFACIGSPQTPQCNQIVSYNNIYYSGGTAIDQARNSIVNGATGTTTSFGLWDYDIVDRTGTATFIRDWGGNTANDYSTLTALFTAQAQEENGVKSNPGLTWGGGVGTITTASPAYNTGVALTNFNDANSAWPYTSTAPDRGAYEVGGTTPPTLSSVSPDFGVQGTTVGVTLTGTGFQGTDSGASTTVTVSGSGITQNTLVVVSDLSITVNFVIAGAATASVRNVSVTSDEGTSNNQSFTVVASGGAPTLSSISPSTGHQDTTIPVTLTGTNFDVGGGTITESCANIAFSSITVVNATTITASVFIASDAALAPCPVAVTTNSGVSNTQDFTPIASVFGFSGRLTSRGGR